MKIELKEYNQEWPEIFQRERDLLVQVAGKWLCGAIEHVGSTSVPGLAAKPIIDIMFGVQSLESAKPAIDELSKHEYCYFPYKPEVMHWFCKPSPESRTHHLHLIPYGSELWKQRLKFRDILRENGSIAKEYSKLKASLALKFPFDREAYTEYKSSFILSVLDGNVDS